MGIRGVQAAGLATAAIASLTLADFGGERDAVYRFVDATDTEREFRFRYSESDWTTEKADEFLTVERSSREACNALADVITGWDLTDADGNPVPVSGDVLYTKLPRHVPHGMVAALYEASTLPKKRKTSSSGSFAATDDDDD